MTPCTCIDIHKYEFAFSRDGAEGYVALFVLFFLSRSYVTGKMNMYNMFIIYVYSIEFN